MSENPSPFESVFRNLPPEYRAWYNSRYTIFGGGQNEPDLTEDNDNTIGVVSGSRTNTNDEWPSSSAANTTNSQNEAEANSNFDNALPRMPQSFESPSSPNNSSRHFFYNQDGAETSTENTERGNLNSWNYLYYLRLLNEVERERRSSQVSTFSGESQETDNSTNENNNPGDKTTESYSEKLKKGLSNEAAAHLSGDKSNFQSQSFPLSESVLKSELPSLKRRNSGNSKSVNKKNSKKKAESNFVKNDEIKLESGGKSFHHGEELEGNYCEACKWSPFAALNNTLPGNSCPSGIKCPLNVNNLHKKEEDEKPGFEEKFGNDGDGERKKDDATSSSKERDKSKAPPPPQHNARNKKNNKARSLLNGFKKETNNAEEVDGDNEVKTKRKNFPVKGRQRTDRGKLPRHSGSRKRHSNETEKESFLDHFATLYSIIWSTVSQWPSQPWFKYTVDGVVSLFGVVVGSLCVFAMIAWEGLKAFKTLCSSYARQGYEWFKLNTISVIFTIFLKTPGLSGYVSKASSKSTDNPKFEKLPSNGSEAVERLLKLKGHDPYLILGVTTDCGDEDIKKRYKSQAVLVHPDKNNFPGAEEAFKVLASAFEILGNPEKRAEFDKENNIRLEGNEEMASFLETIQKNIEEMQSILGCRSCGKSHKRYKTEKQADNARFCASCKTHHAARLGDLWAETSMFGFKWHYYAYLDNSIYDVTEWVTCQTDLMATVEANTHAVPCRLATPKNKNRTAAQTRMEDLKDLVNELLNKNRRGSNVESAFPTTSGEKTNEGKPNKTGGRKQGGSNAPRRRK